MGNFSGVKRRNRGLTQSRPTADLSAATLDSVRGGRSYQADTAQEDAGEQVYLHYELKSVLVTSYSMMGDGI